MSDTIISGCSGWQVKVREGYLTFQGNVVFQIDNILIQLTREV
jgi:hypothetical protein